MKQVSQFLETRESGRIESKPDDLCSGTLELGEPSSSVSDCFSHANSHLWVLSFTLVVKIQGFHELVRIHDLLFTMIMEVISKQRNL